jgi:hypothetical protein
VREGSDNCWTQCKAWPNEHSNETSLGHMATLTGNQPLSLSFDLPLLDQIDDAHLATGRSLTQTGRQSDRNVDSRFEHV